MIPHKGKVDPVSVQNQVVKEDKVQESEEEQVEAEENNAVEEIIADKETDSEDEKISANEEEITVEVVEAEKNYEVVLSEEMNYGEAEWVDTPYEVEPGICVQYNKAMLNATNSDKKYGNVIYIKDKPIVLPIRMSDFFEVVGEDSTSFNHNLDAIIGQCRTQGLKCEPAITYSAIYLSNDGKNAVDNWYIYEINVYVYDGFFAMTDIPMDIVACKVVLPGGLIVNDNIDLTLHYGLEEDGEVVEWYPTNKRVYHKNGYSTYTMIADSSLIPENVIYTLDFIREAIPSSYNTQYDAALASFVEDENYQREVARLREESLLFGNSKEKYGNVLTIDGVEVRFPMTLKDFKDLGFEIDEQLMKESCPKGVLEPKKSINLIVETSAENGDWELQVLGANPAGIELKLDDIYLYGIEIVNMIGIPPIEIILPGNILLRENMKEVLWEQLGRTSEYDNGNRFEWRQSLHFTDKGGNYIIIQDKAQITYKAYIIQDGGWNTNISLIKRK